MDKRRHASLSDRIWPPITFIGLLGADEQEADSTTAPIRLLTSVATLSARASAAGPLPALPGKAARTIPKNAGESVSVCCFSFVSIGGTDPSKVTD